MWRNQKNIKKIVSILSWSFIHILLEDPLIELQDVIILNLDLAHFFFNINSKHMLKKCKWFEDESLGPVLDTPMINTSMIHDDKPHPLAKMHWTLFQPVNFDLAIYC